MMSGNDLLEMNCARCGKTLLVRVDDARQAMVVECEECANLPPFSGRSVFVALSQEPPFRYRARTT